MHSPKRYRSSCIASPLLVVKDGGDSRTVLASASEDGLVVVHNLSMPTEVRVLVLVLNVGMPV